MPTLDTHEIDISRSNVLMRLKPEYDLSASDTGGVHPIVKSVKIFGPYQLFEACNWQYSLVSTFS